jgi:hypothetical protein
MSKKLEITPLFQDGRKKLSFVKRIKRAFKDMLCSNWEEICCVPIKNNEAKKLPAGYLFVYRNTFTRELKGEIVTQNNTRKVDLRYYEGQLVAKSIAVPWKSR